MRMVLAGDDAISTGVVPVAETSSAKADDEAKKNATPTGLSTKEWETIKWALRDTLMCGFETACTSTEPVEWVDNSYAPMYNMFRLALILTANDGS